MGREWYFNWGTKSSSKKRADGGGAKGGERKMGASPVATVAAAAATGGCMKAVLHLFYFNHLQLCLHPHDSVVVQPPPSCPSILSSHKPTSQEVNSGLEAPRNSLESLEDMVTGPLSLATIMEDNNERNHSSKIPASKKNTKLKLVQAPRGKLEDVSSVSSNSPAGTRTPSLVARLMGLDILPESTTTTPRSSTSQPLRSPHLPASTPRSRSSKARAKISHHNNNNNNNVVVEQPRLSLQMNRENSIVKEMESSRPSCSAISTKKREGQGRSCNEEECRSPGYYARQIMKQVKENVGRRVVGADITNTVTRRDGHLLTLTKSKKSNKSSEVGLSEEAISKSDERVSISCVKLEEHKHCSNKLDQGSKKLSYTNKSSSKKPPLKSLDSIRNKKEVQFVHHQTRANGSSDNKCKTMALSSAPFKKESPPTKLLHKQGVLSKDQSSTRVSTIKNTISHLSQVPIQRYKRGQKEAMHTPAAQGQGRRKNSSSIAEFQYISRILKCTGIDRDTPVSFTRWFSPSNPLDPSIFPKLENAHYALSSDYSSSCHHQGLGFDRKLIFHLVDEILGDMLKSCINSSGQNRLFHHQQQQQQRQVNGFQLVKALCAGIRNFPSSNCQNQQDIDALIEKDLGKSGAHYNVIAFEEEGVGLISEIERDIMDSLIQEMAVIIWGNHIRSYMQRYVTS